MPELPDVEVFKRYFDVTALHKKVRDVDVRTTEVLKGISASRLAGELKGNEFQSSKRHGKYILVKLAERKWYYMHFGMTGELKYYKDEDDQPEYSQVIIALTNDFFLAYISKRKLGAISVIEDLAAFIKEKRLGPDALDLEFNQFTQILRDSNAAVKSGLMKQSLIAGIGNIYSDEILFQARVYPKKKMNKLGNKELKRLYTEMRNVLNMAIERKANPEELPDSYLLPHRNEEANCPRCGGKVKKVAVSGRSGYFCPRCQKR